MSAAQHGPASGARSTRADVRNPMLKIPEVREAFNALPAEAREALVKMLRGVSRACRESAAHAYRTHKPPMYTYWQGLAVNARHLALAGRSQTQEGANQSSGRSTKPNQQRRSIEGVCALAGLVGYDVPAADAALLTDEQLRELEVWAERTHLRASDNPVRVPPKPRWLLGLPWQGPEDTWGNGPTLVDCAAIAREAKAVGGAK
ncbi:hypothetical protein [Variovorax guangxiensis]|uniref:Uncharacterized protein n=1 Tax=Variovorax guangxiensis TaxID=1775474 RepID=A0A840G0I3_9BURK|nr:hypothetical protein [Variovorax guangxiensis]MBB4225994.1 hypothetical protein [Variovorax guangxiensis]